MKKVGVTDVFGSLTLNFTLKNKEKEVVSHSKQKQDDIQMGLFFEMKSLSGLKTKNLEGIEVNFIGLDLKSPHKQYISLSYSKDEVCRTDFNKLFYLEPGALRDNIELVLKFSYFNDQKEIFLGYCKFKMSEMRFLLNPNNK